MSVSESQAVRPADSGRMQRVSPRARWMWLVENAIGTTVLIAIVVAAHLFGWLAGGWFLAALVALLCLGVAGCVIVPVWRYRVHRWAVTDDSIITRTGWLTQEQREAPFNRVQTVDVHRGPWHQVFALSKVVVTTASAHGTLDIDGIDKQSAEQLADRLTRIAASYEGDAT